MLKMCDSYVVPYMKPLLLGPTVGIKSAVVQCSIDLLRPVEGDHFEFV